MSDQFGLISPFAAPLETRDVNSNLFYYINILLFGRRTSGVHN